MRTWPAPRASRTPRSPWPTRTAGRSGGMLTVYPVEQWVPRAHRHAYFEAAATVLGYKPLVA